MPAALLTLSLARILDRAGIRAKGQLFRLASEILETPPSGRQIETWMERLESLTLIPPRTGDAVRMLRDALTALRRSPGRICAAWTEYSKLLGHQSSAGVSLYASAHCNAATLARLNDDTCPYEAGKPCPFGDFHCVERMGAPCAHGGAALALAARHWHDWAAAVNARDESRKRAHCRKLLREKLSPWLGASADELFMKANTPLYQATALLVGALLQEETE